jgi:hypothetical protein
MIVECNAVEEWSGRVQERVIGTEILGPLSSVSEYTQEV